jgi:hypothetical protein
MRQEQLLPPPPGFEVTYILTPDTFFVHLYGVNAFNHENITFFRKTKQYFYGAEPVQEMNIFLNIL